VVLRPRCAGLRALELEEYIVTGVRKETSADGTDRLLARLAGLSLVENTGEGQSRGAANAWSLTRKGR
jgi:hypothetical protein